MKVVKEAKKLYAALPATTDTAGGYSSDKPLALAGFGGEGEPIFTDEAIEFNGGGDDLDHEDFGVYPNPANDICKTARKPYDLMVCAVLLSMKRHMVNFKLSSDGYHNGAPTEDWDPAKDFYEKVCGKK